MAKSKVKKDRYAIQLPDKRWVSIKGPRGTLYSHAGVGSKKQLPPDHYTDTNIYKVLEVRKRILKGEPVLRVKGPGNYMEEFFTEVQCVKLSYGDT